jgi:thiol-disulfide isomerase/thioredoxin
LSTQRGTSLGTYVIVAVVSAIIGFGAIYVIVGLGDNAPSINTAVDKPKPPPTAPKSVAPQAPTPATTAKLNTGAMATFVFKDTPTALPPFTFTDAEGNDRTLDDWRGKVVLLNLWATWCAPCIREMPHLDRLKASLGSNKFDVLAISVDRGGPAKPRAFRDKAKIKHLKFYQDPTAKLGFALKVIGMPVTLLLDTQGREIGRLVGPAEWDSAAAIRLIKAHFDR